jgi:hypothetical protein
MAWKRSSVRSRPGPPIFQQLSGCHVVDGRGRHLHRESCDETLRIARYRAQPHHCNSCAVKSRCTDSDTGRVLEDQAETWVQSGMRRFHRGMSVTLLVLAATILGIEIVRQHQLAEQLFIACFLLCIADCWNPSCKFFAVLSLRTRRCSSWTQVTSLSTDADSMQPRSITSLRIKCNRLHSIPSSLSLQVRKRSANNLLDNVLLQ